jgi:glutathione reductase (NADPH)
MQSYDLIVLGTGVAGSKIATQCRKAGWTVAIVDSREFGGTCALRGCSPKKVLTAAADVVDRSRHLREKGISGSIQLDWASLIAFKNTFTNPIPYKTEEKFVRQGIDTYHGYPSFVAPDTLALNSIHLIGAHIVIATGAKPRPLDFPGHEHIITSEQFLALDTLPQRILFVGAGYISMELSHVAIQAGATVTMLEMLDRPLMQFDPDLVNMLMEASQEKGIDIHVKTPVKSVEKTPDGFVVHAGSDGEQKFEADLVAHGAGRVSNIDGLELAQGNVTLDDRRIVINEYLQSVSNPAVYIAGDVNAQGIPLTPVASMEADVVIQNLLEGNSAIPNYTGVPSIVFTSPMLASAGLTEQEADEQDIPYTVIFQNTSTWSTTQRLGLKYSALKVLVHKDTHTVVGAHLLGHGVDEDINLYALLIRVQIGLQTIADTVWAYPTVFDYHVDAMV